MRQHTPTPFTKLSADDQALVQRIATNGSLPITAVGSMLYPLNEFITFDWPPGAQVINGTSHSTPIALLTQHAKDELAKQRSTP